MKKISAILGVAALWIGANAAASPFYTTEDLLRAWAKPSSEQAQVASGYISGVVDVEMARRSNMSMSRCQALPGLLSNDKVIDLIKQETADFPASSQKRPAEMIYMVLAMAFPCR